MGYRTRIGVPVISTCVLRREMPPENLAAVCRRTLSRIGMETVASIRDRGTDEELCREEPENMMQNREERARQRIMAGILE